ncbi:hypothetical protein MKW92_042539, partial [Papaver armeniacum]
MRFDKVFLNIINERVSDLPDPQLYPAVKEAFDVAYDSVYAFHFAQKGSRVLDASEVSMCITSVGLYLCFWGTAVLPTTALMLAV